MFINYGQYFFFIHPVPSIAYPFSDFFLLFKMPLRQGKS